MEGGRISAADEARKAALIQNIRIEPPGAGRVEYRYNEIVIILSSVAADDLGWTFHMIGEARSIKLTAEQDDPTKPYWKVTRGVGPENYAGPPPDNWGPDTNYYEKRMYPGCREISVVFGG